jgi:hypothetical protein
MRDKAWFEQKLKDIRAGLIQARANLSATEGAEQLCVQILAEWPEDPPLPAVDPPVDRPTG